jgi:predicted O-methyltransferase YrrM
MIVDERYVTYLHSLERRNSEFLETLELEAIQTRVPIIRKETQSLLRFLIQLSCPTKILEVGTAIGFSALFMEEVNPVNCQITTIENYDKRIPIARRNFELANKNDRITLMEGDAQRILPTLEGSFDFIFMDAAKGQYLHFLPLVLQLLKPGAIIVSDNVLQDGDIIQSRFAVTRRNRTIHKRMREYLYSITHNEELTTTILTVGDGIAISVKK